eukprot:TRINITY_DN2955_c1_g2_i1.p1 TRINITY_DN2955_c1_g2~~TRINITY_DN2955_c1_g2_i1.p1  ORF type:complete len:775 (+),score=231.09 TRINITY_DN2955_c1_g2_i1:200-2326(+)
MNDIQLLSDHYTLFMENDKNDSVNSSSIIPYVVDNLSYYKHSRNCFIDCFGNTYEFILREHIEKEEEQEEHEHEQEEEVQKEEEKEEEEQKKEEEDETDDDDNFKEDSGNESNSDDDETETREIFCSFPVGRNASMFNFENFEAMKDILCMHVNNLETNVNYSGFMNLFKFLASCVFHTYDENQPPNLIVYVNDLNEELLFYSIIKTMNDWCFCDDINGKYSFAPPNFILKEIDELNTLSESFTNSLPILYLCKDEELFEQFENNFLMEMLNISMDCLNIFFDDSVEDSNDSEHFSIFDIVKIFLKNPIQFLYCVIMHRYEIKMIETPTNFDTLRILLAEKPDISKSLFNMNSYGLSPFIREENNDYVDDAENHRTNGKTDTKFKKNKEAQEMDENRYRKSVKARRNPKTKNKIVNARDSENMDLEFAESIESLKSKMSLDPRIAAEIRDFKNINKNPEINITDLIHQGYLVEGNDNWMFSDVLSSILHIVRGNHLNINISSDINTRYLKNAIVLSDLSFNQKETMIPHRRKLISDNRFSFVDELQLLKSEKKFWVQKFLVRLWPIVFERFEQDNDEKNLEMLFDVCETLTGMRQLERIKEEVKKMNEEKGLSQEFINEQDKLEKTALKLLGCDSIFEHLTPLQYAGTPFLSAVLPTEKHVKEGKYNISLGISLTVKGIIHFCDDLFIIAGKRIHHRRNTTYANFSHK